MPWVVIGAIGIGAALFGSKVASAVDFLKEFFGNVGHYCAEILEGALNLFSTLVNSSVNFLTTGIDSSEFADFNQVVTNVSQIICVIASTVLVLLFLVNMCTDAWDGRHELDLWQIMKEVCKMIVSLALINNALRIVKGIFTMGAKVAYAVLYADQAFKNGQLVSTVENSDIGINISLNSRVSDAMTYQLSGMKGTIAFLLFCFLALAIIYCGIQITLEIYQRIFKMFVLIPFSTIAFSTFVMGDGNQGNQVFHGYLKSIITTAIEAVVIVMCVLFCQRLITNGKTMEKLLGINTDSQTEITVEFTSEEEFSSFYSDLQFFNNYATNPEMQEAMYEQFGFTADEIEEKASGKVKEVAEKLNGKEIGGARFYEKSTGKEVELLSVASKFPKGGIVVKMMPAMDWGTILLLGLSIFFPVSLCTAVVKQASSYSNMIMGKG